MVLGQSPLRGGGASRQGKHIARPWYRSRLPTGFQETHWTQQPKPTS